MPRKGLGAVERRAARPGFNEAGAFMPRKVPTARRIAQFLIAGFNEAGAFMPRKAGRQR